VEGNTIGVYMTDILKPRKGSLAYRPRKRARKQMPTINYWAPSGEGRVLGLAGYKAGMTHIHYVEDIEGPAKGQEISTAVTVIEVPPLMVYGIRTYSGRKCSGEVLIEKEDVLKRIGVRKKKTAKEAKADGCEEVALLVYAQPEKTGIGKKHAERMELRVGGADAAAKIEFAKGMLGKELRASEVFRPGEFVDVISVTKGKGWQGTVKRFGTGLQRPKATGKRRHIGCMGQFKPGYIFYTIPRPGQTGYHKRTELNKRIMKISGNIDEVNPKGGFPRYGFVKNEYVLIRGSVPGPVKRLVRFRLGVRKGAAGEPKLTGVSLESKV